MLTTFDSPAYRNYTTSSKDMNRIFYSPRSWDIVMNVHYEPEEPADHARDRILKHCHAYFGKKQDATTSIFNACTKPVRVFGIPHFIRLLLCITLMNRIAPNAP
jgi:hypothetical protein